jgi:putative sterol carrier protein
MVFKSLFNRSSSSDTSDKPKTSAEADPDTSKTGGLDPQLFAMLQGMTPFMVPPGTEEAEAGQAVGPKVVDNSMAANLMSFLMPGAAEALNSASKATPTEKKETGFSPFRVLKLVEPLINEAMVKEIQTVYEFQIRMDSTNPDLNYKQSEIEVFHLDLKNAPKGLIGRGPSLFGKSDCTIKLSDQDLTELLMDKLKPFTAYMSGRIEIEGDLQDVFKLKKLIKSVSTFSNIKNAN